MKFEIRNSRNGQFYFRIVAANGKKLAHSEQYTTKQSCRKAISIIIDGAADALVLDKT